MITQHFYDAAGAASAVGGAGAGSSLGISTRMRFFGAPAERGPKDIDPYMPLLRYVGLITVVECTVCI
jgi:hypothetical protein